MNDLQILSIATIILASVAAIAVSRIRAIGGKWMNSSDVFSPFPNSLILWIGVMGGSLSGLIHIAIALLICAIGLTA